ncbi:MAG TPA: Gfo/Idh/MocA family oxidoreductase [Caulobacteraceae bacterium]|jgi:predicted dehydrogenase|nr:Gfo/Idh/MocA family oxidoreductase [Caulobacteraceae bacterium]
MDAAGLLIARIGSKGAGLLQAGVAGAGVFGGYHARKYAALEGVRLAAVYDHHLVHAEALAGPLGAQAFDDLDAFLAAVDVVTVATPGDSHAAIGLAALAADRHAYVEKPLAATGADALAMVAAAQARGLVLASGHQERVVFEAMGLMAVSERPLRIEAVRLGTPSERNRDVSCAPDLMIHDLDLALALAGAGTARVTAAEGGFDVVTAEVDFGGGLTGRFEASRQAPARRRTMRLVYPSGVVEIDFLAPAFANGTAHRLDAGFADTPQGRDPLGASVGRFLAAVEGRGRPAVTGEEGARALELALAIEGAL